MLTTLSLTLDVLQRRFHHNFHFEITPPVLSPWMTLPDCFLSSCHYLSAMKVSDSFHLIKGRRASNISLSSILEKSILLLTTALVDFIPKAVSSSVSIGEGDLASALVIDSNNLLPFGWSLPYLLPLISEEFREGVYVTLTEERIMNLFFQTLVSNLLTSHPLDLILQFLSSILTSSLLKLFIENYDLKDTCPREDVSCPTRLLLNAAANSFRIELLLSQENIWDYLFTNFIQQDLEEYFVSEFILEMKSFLHCLC